MGANIVSMSKEATSDAGPKSGISGLPGPLDWGALSSLIEEAKPSETSIYDELRAVDVRYLRSEPHNKGGMKVILRTHDAMTGRPMAMAKLPKGAKPRAIENFLREARITAHLEHPNIVPIYDIGLDDSRKPYFTMKLLSGSNLGKILAKLRAGDPVVREQYTRAALVDIFLKICDAIAYAHASGVIHLDLKPENIQISNYGEVLVCDWGLAKLVNTDCGSERSILDDSSLYTSCVNYLTVDGFFSGTPGYMAPEQATGGRKRAKTEQTDIYSLGCLLYSILTYECPIEGENVDVVLARTRAGEFQAPRKRMPTNDIPHSLEAVVLKAMALKPEDRYESVQHMITDILSYRDGYATAAEGAGFWTQFKLLIKRNPKIAYILLATLLLLSGIIAHYTSALRERERVALKNLEMYVKEREWRTNYEAAPDYYYEAFELYKDGDFERAGQKVRIALDYDKRLFRAWELKGNVHFSQMEFDKAQEAYANVQTKNGESLARLCQRLAAVPRDIDGDYNLEQAGQLIKQLGPFRKALPARNMLAKYLETTDMNLEDRMAFISNIWVADASSKSPLKCRYKVMPQGVSLDLSGNRGSVDVQLLRGTPVLKLIWDRAVVTQKDLSYIQNLPIRELSLRDTRGFTQVDELQELPLESLNLAGSQVRSITGLKDMSIKTLDLRRIDRLNSRWLRFLISECEVGTVFLDDDLSRYGPLISDLSQVTEVKLVR